MTVATVILRPLRRPAVKGAASMPRLFVLNALVGGFKGSPMPEAMFTSSSISSGFLHASLDEANETVIGIGSFRHSVRK